MYSLCTLQSLIAEQAEIIAQGGRSPNILINTQDGLNAQGGKTQILINAQNGINVQCNFCWDIHNLPNCTKMGKIEEKIFGEKSKKLRKMPKNLNKCTAWIFS